MEMFFVIPAVDWAKLAVAELSVTGNVKSVNLLVSYYYFQTEAQLIALRDAIPTDVDAKWFLDSGAFSALTKNATILLNEYADWVVMAERVFGKARVYTYSNLDVIGNESKTWRNQRVLEVSGLAPRPVIHSNADMKTITKITDRYSEVSVGGMVGGGYNSKAFEQFLSVIFEEMTRRHADYQVHGFGVTSLPIMRKYPFTSVDSSSWMAGARWGRLLLFDPRISKMKVVNMKDPTQNLESIELLNACYPYNMTEMQRLRASRSGEWRGVIGALSMISYLFITDQINQKRTP